MTGGVTQLWVCGRRNQIAMDHGVGATPFIAYRDWQGRLL